MEETPIGQLIIALESMRLQVTALEEALLKVKGFYREEADGSQQGLIKFSPVDSQAQVVEPMA